MDRHEAHRAARIAEKRRVRRITIIGWTIAVIVLALVIFVFGWRGVEGCPSDSRVGGECHTSWHWGYL